MYFALICSYGLDKTNTQYRNLKTEVMHVTTYLAIWHCANKYLLQKATFKNQHQHLCSRCKVYVANINDYNAV